MRKNNIDSSFGVAATARWGWPPFDCCRNVAWNLGTGYPTGIDWDILFVVDGVVTRLTDRRDSSRRVLSCRTQLTGDSVHSRPSRKAGALRPGPPRRSSAMPEKLPHTSQLSGSGTIVSHTVAHITGVTRVPTIGEGRLLDADPFPVGRLMPRSTL
eukprot:3608906-Prymnesium_polylepis.2